MSLQRIPGVGYVSDTSSVGLRAESRLGYAGRNVTQLARELERVIPLEPITPIPVQPFTAAPSGILTRSEQPITYTPTSDPIEAPMSIALPMSPRFGSTTARFSAPQLTTGPGPLTSYGTQPIPGVTGGIGAGSGGGIIGTANDIIDVISRAKGIFSGGGAPTIAAPSSGPGITQAGLGSSIGTLIGAGARAVTKGKIPGVVGGIIGYYVLDKALGWIFKPGKIPSRRMNVLNPRALSRADRRTSGFRKVATKMLSKEGFTVKRRGAGGFGRCAPKKKCGCK